MILNGLVLPVPSKIWLKYWSWPLQKPGCTACQFGPRASQLRYRCPSKTHRWMSRKSATLDHFVTKVGEFAREEESMGVDDTGSARTANISSSATRRASEGVE